MIFPQFVIYVLIYDYLKFRKDPSIPSQEIANYLSVALAVALSVDRYYRQCTPANPVVRKPLRLLR